MLYDDKHYKPNGRASIVKEHRSPFRGFSSITFSDNTDSLIKPKRRLLHTV